MSGHIDGKGTHFGGSAPGDEGMDMAQTIHIHLFVNWNGNRSISVVGSPPRLDPTIPHPGEPVSGC
jgi:hypothetical protein